MLTLIIPKSEKKFYLMICVITVLFHISLVEQVNFFFIIKYINDYSIHKSDWENSGHQCPKWSLKFHKWYQLCPVKWEVVSYIGRLPWFSITDVMWCQSELNKDCIVKHTCNYHDRNFQVNTVSIILELTYTPFPIVQYPANIWSRFFPGVS